MMTGNQARKVPTPGAADASEFRLEALDLLPCGCIVAIQRMTQSGVRVVSMETKGPHCLDPGHRANRVLRLGDVPGITNREDYDDEETWAA